MHQETDTFGPENEACKVSGMGAAVYFYGSSMEGCNLMARLATTALLIYLFGYVIVHSGI